MTDPIVATFTASAPVIFNVNNGTPVIPRKADAVRFYQTDINLLTSNPSLLTSWDVEGAGVFVPTGCFVVSKVVTGTPPSGEFDLVLEKNNSDGIILRFVKTLDAGDFAIGSGNMFTLLSQVNQLGEEIQGFVLESGDTLRLRNRQGPITGPSVWTGDVYVTGFYGEPI